MISGSFGPSQKGFRAWATTLAVAAAFLCFAVEPQSVYGSGFLNPYPTSDPTIVDDIATPPTPKEGPNTVTATKQTAAKAPYVRLGYVIPSNRSEQPRGVETIRYMIIAYQSWLRDQMRQHGQGPKTIVYETEPDGVTPTVHVIHVAETDAYIREDIWGRTMSAVSDAGVALWQPGEVWLLITETHLQSPDGDVVGGVALGGSWGSGSDPGVAMLGGDALAVLRPDFAADDRRYHDTILPEIGPYLLKQDISFAWFEGETYSSLHSSYLGAGMHELGHALGLPHDMRNDNNFDGNLMGNGLRGFRGCTHPGRYPDDFTRLSHAAALMFSKSRYFNPPGKDTTRPSLTVSTQGAASLVNGLLPVQFSAADDRGLATAWLMWQGDMVGEIALSGKDVDQQFTTEYFDVGVERTYTVAVFDVEGNKTNQDVAITASGKSDAAPRPFLRVTPPVMFQGESFVLDASGSSDPDESAAGLLVEWDLDGDGFFDTTPTTSKTYTVVANDPGPTPIRSRITDGTGNSTVSTAFFVDPHAPALRATTSGGFSAIEWDSAFGFTYQVQLSATLKTWTTKYLPLSHGDGSVQQYQPSSGEARVEFYRLESEKRQN